MTSNRQVDRAADVIRQRIADSSSVSLADTRAAVAVCKSFRATHVNPLASANMGLRSCMATIDLNGHVTQRFKRWATIVDKLRREPSMKLTRMQDIGGCRAVVRTPAEAARLVSRFGRNSKRRNGTEDRVIDYTEQPRESGYRAVHVHTKYGGRRIEVQVRTPLQHLWAVTVETTGSRLGFDLKSGRGPAPVLDLLRHAAEGMAIEEAGGTADNHFMEELTRLQTAAAPHLAEGRAQ